ncbi:ScbR family autoregulator-binding transcription factor [Streptomyces sp. NPDC049881]|uniref:ScbR family autoregulator-binding transcription factor n=1 Tax=Streptomyces sp. NPDC049881 TaxID=3155778 RepID=UPI0034386287
MQERAQQTRERLLISAAEVFDEYGYAGASIAKIVERSASTSGAIYFHFGSKEKLAREVMDHQPETVMPFVGSRGVQRVVDVCLVWARQLQSDPVLRAGVRLAVEQSAFGGRDAASFLSWVEIIRQSLQDAAEAGELLDGVVPEDVAEYVVGASTGVQILSDLVSGRRDLPERVARMWRYLLPVVVRAELLPAIRLDIESPRPEGPGGV